MMFSVEYLPGKRNGSFLKSSWEPFRILSSCSLRKILQTEMFASPKKPKCLKNFHLCFLSVYHLYWHINPDVFLEMDCFGFACVQQIFLCQFWNNNDFPPKVLQNVKQMIDL